MNLLISFFILIIGAFALEHHLSPRIVFTRTKCLLYISIKRFGVTIRKQFTLFNL